MICVGCLNHEGSARIRFQFFFMLGGPYSSSSMPLEFAAELLVKRVDAGQRYPAPLRQAHTTEIDPSNRTGPTAQRYIGMFPIIQKRRAGPGHALRP